MDKLRALAMQIADTLEDAMDYVGPIVLIVLLIAVFVAAVLGLLVAIKLLFWLLFL